VTVSGLDVVRPAGRDGEGNGMMTAQPDRMTTRPHRRRHARGRTAERSRCWRRTSPRFRALVDLTRAARGADFSVCDIVLPVQVSGGSVA
jgi:peptidylprolyl isomerase